jgi:hypothetical protein
MAAEYLNTVIKGKLQGAKLAMMKKGQWVGGTVPTGYIVDKRKNLPGGSANPHWRKYSVFEAYADCIREYFALFKKFNGNLRRTAKHIQQYGPFYPDPNITPVPSGFDTRYTINWNGNGYCPSHAGLNDLLSNSVYIGHWSVKGVIVDRNNHPRIVDDDLFMHAFNRLSRVDFDGNPNTNFNGTYSHHRPSLQDERKCDPPLFLGLIYSHDDTKWRVVGHEYANRDSFYRYVFRANSQFSHMLWSRNARRIDEIIVEMLHTKLSATFDADVWSETLASAIKQFSQEEKRLEKQLTVLETTIQNQIANLDNVTHIDLVQAIEKRYQSALQEKERLNAELADMRNEQARIKRIQELQENWSVVLSKWDSYDYAQKRNVAEAFIRRIEISATSRKGTIVNIHWRDNTSDEQAHRPFSAKGKKWLQEEIELIHWLYEQDAGQLEIAVQFPGRKWNKLFGVIHEKYGDEAHRFDYQPIKWQETFSEFADRHGDGSLPLRSPGLAWRPAEDEKLKRLVEISPSKIEIAKHFRFRTWRTIRERIAQIIATGVKIEGKGKKTVMLKETYMEYLVRIGELDVNSLPTLHDIISEAESSLSLLYSLSLLG